MPRNRGLTGWWLLMAASGGILVASLFLGQGDPRVMIWLRLPRLMLGLLCGAVLSGTGAAYQAMLNNPLGDPYLLGVSSAAAFGATIAAILGLWAIVPLAGFAGALTGMIIVWRLAHNGGEFDRTRLLMSGIFVGMFFSAVISLILYIYMEDAGRILNILLGSLNRVFTIAEWAIFRIVFLVSLVLLGFLLSLGRKFDIITSGDEVASSLGLDVNRFRRVVFLVCSLLTGFTVAYGGIIGFVGLMIPHLVRGITGPGQKNVLGYSMVTGALLLPLCDLAISRLMINEIPVGVLTALIGSPFFFLLLMRDQKGAR